MRNLTIIYLVIMFLVLSGCGSIYDTVYTYQLPAREQNKLCIKQCVVMKYHCQSIAQFQDKNCRLRERKKAFNRYEIYKNQQKLQSKPVTRNIGSFDNSFSVCESPENHCTMDFNICYQKCGGEVREQRVCTAFCH